MSGIAGIFHLPVPKPVDPARVRAMSDALARSGSVTDVWSAPGIGLGHAAAPILTRDRQLALTLEGRIYNCSQVRTELEALGHVFETRGEAALILAAWRQWGPGFLSRLDGTFALAVFDASAQTLFLARDRLGVQPLHYTELSDGSLAFASGLEGLLAHPLLRRKPSPQAVEDYLAFGYVPDDACLIAGVRKLPAGHCLLARRGQPLPEPASWWGVDFRRKARGSAEKFTHDLTDLMRETIRSRMASDRGVGASLTSDIGSAAVVAFMAEASRTGVETVSVSLEGGGPAKSSNTALVTQRFATRHRSEAISPNAFDALEMLSATFEEPFADLSALAACRLATLARERLGVLLAGAGADELFGGHARYRRFVAMDRMAGILPPSVRGKFPIAGGEAYATALSMTPRPLRNALYSAEFRSLIQGHRAEDRYVRTMGAAPAEDALSRAQYADLKISVPGNLLAMLDRAGKAAGIEIRLPLLDHRLVEFAAGLPPRMRLRGGNGTWLLKQALDGFLPAELLGRKTRSASLRLWSLSGLAERAGATPNSPVFSQLGWFDRSILSRIVTDHRAGRVDHGRLLWQLLVLEGSLQRLFAIGVSSSGYRASAKNRPSGGALKPRAARSRA